MHSNLTRMAAAVRRWCRPRWGGEAATDNLKPWSRGTSSCMSSVKMSETAPKTCGDFWLELSKSSAPPRPTNSLLCYALMMIFDDEPSTNTIPPINVLTTDAHLRRNSTHPLGLHRLVTVWPHMTQPLPTPPHPPPDMSCDVITWRAVVPRTVT